MALKYKDSKIMSNQITLTVGIDGDELALERTLLSFRNFRNLLSDGIIDLDETSIDLTLANPIHVQDLLNALINIYESEYHVSKLKLDSKLQDGEIIKE